MSQTNLEHDHPPIFAKPYRIYLEDTDAGGIVYHANHLRLFERCRRDWLRNLGMTSYFYQTHSADTASQDSTIATPDIQFVVSQATIKYLRPILLDSEVTVMIKTADCKSASLQLDQRIYDSDQQLLSQADIHIVCVTTTKDAASKNNSGHTRLRPTRLPSAFVQLINSPH